MVHLILLYRSEKIGKKLKKLGFKNVVNLYGGIFEWVNSGYPVYDSKGETEKIHPYDVPEIAEIDIHSINQPYLKWLIESTN